MIKGLLVALAIVLLTLIGCGNLTNGASSGASAPAPVSPIPTPNPTSDSDVEARLVDKTWISPAMVQIGNYYPGARAEWNLRIHNGNDVATDFVISYRVPHTAKEGYAMPPIEAKDWIIVADPTPVLAPKETKEILVVLAMPKEAIVQSGKWEFWTVVMEAGQGQVQTEMATRWLVVMRGK